jgi:hypothetical protein
MTSIEFFPDFPLSDITLFLQREFGIENPDPLNIPAQMQLGIHRVLTQTKDAAIVGGFWNGEIANDPVRGQIIGVVAFKI